MRIHQYHVDVAVEVGVNAATLFYNILFWCEKNEANKRNIHEGRAWTYNSRRAWAELFPQFSEQNIKTAIKKLEKAKFILSGNFNKMPMDKTKWYSVSDEAYEFLNKTTIGCIEPTDRLESTNGVVRINQAIPDNKPNNKPDSFYEAIKDAWNNTLDISPAIRSMTNKRKQGINGRIEDCKGMDKDMTKIEHWQQLFDYINSQSFLIGNNDRNWQADIDWVLKPQKFIRLIEGRYV